MNGGMSALLQSQFTLWCFFFFFLFFGSQKIKGAKLSCLHSNYGEMAPSATFAVVIATNWRRGALQVYLYLGIIFLFFLFDCLFYANVTARLFVESRRGRGWWWWLSVKRTAVSAVVVLVAKNTVSVNNCFLLLFCWFTNKLSTEYLVWIREQCFRKKDFLAVQLAKTFHY